MPAERFRFDRTVTAGASPVLDVTTEGGNIAILAGDPGEIAIHGTVTLREGPDVPSDAVALAKQTAAQPPIEQDNGTLRVRPPVDSDVRRAVIVSYEIRVPSETRAIAASDSGAVSIDGLSTPLSVKTLSGAVEISGARGAVAVRTASGGIELVDLRAGLEARSESGRVSASLAGSDDVDVQTQSGNISLVGVKGAVIATTKSGDLDVAGTVSRDWNIATMSGSIEVALVSVAAASIEATTVSGSVVVDGLRLDGTNERQHVAGNIGPGGPRVHLTSKSGSIRIRPG
jgi:DUF4097 and DUF4098 domain-containing protein YvlB